MKLSGKAGFTIVETMLFLGITAFLIVGFLAGTGNTINNQRYRDSVESIAATLQQQYSDVLNVSNTRNTTSSMTCTGMADIYAGGSSPKKIGQSDCVFLGKYITYSASTDKLVIRTVVGNPKPNTDPLSQSSDIAALNDYNIKPLIATANNDFYLEWSPTLVNTAGSPISFSVLILRSPLSGSARTFINNTGITADSNISTLVQNSYLINSLKMCVKRDSVSTMKKSAVVIIANATASSGVQTQGGGTSLCN